MPLISLTNHQLDRFLSKRLRNYKGAFPMDYFEKAFPSPGSSYIINLDREEGDGTHWVALYIPKHGACEYFDSYGVVPSDTIVKFLRRSAKRNKRKITYNSDQLQELGTAACGWYCLLFLLQRAEGKSFYDFIHQFDIDKEEENESTLINILKDYIN